MNFHDQRGHYEYIAKWLETQDLEIDWEALKQTDWWVAPADWVPPPKWSLPKPFPKPLTPQMVTNLLLAREKRGLEIPKWVVDPMEQRENLKLVDPGEGGIEPRLAGELTTGLSYWEKFLLQLEALQLTKITISLVTESERRALVKWACVEEEIRERERVKNCERVARQKERGEESEMERGSDRGGVVPGTGQKLSRGQQKRLDYRRRMERGAMKEEEDKANEEVAGEAVKEERGADMGGAVRVEESAGLLPEVAEVGEVGRGGIERELEVVRVGPNPRILRCRYKELASERECLVMVKSVKNFVKGMRFVMEEPRDEGEYLAAWKYVGAMPRYRGKW